MKTKSLLLLLAGLAGTVQAQPAGAPPPLPPGLPPIPIPMRTNRLANPGMTNSGPLRATNRTVLAEATNVPSTTSATAGTAKTPTPTLNGVTTVTSSTPRGSNAAPATGMAATRPNAAPPSTTTTVPAVPSALPPGIPAFGQTAGPGGAAAPATAGAGANAAAAGAMITNDDVIFPAGLIKFQGADLDQVLEIYQEFTGRTVMRPSSLPAAKISIKSQTPLTRKEAIQALDTILAMNQIAMIPQGDKFVKAVPEANATVQAAEFNELPGQELENTTRFITQIVQLKNALPREVAPALAPLAKLPGNGIMAIDSSGILVIRDYEENVKRMLELLEKIDVVPQQEFEPIVIPIKYALASDIAQVLGSLTAGGGGAGVTVGRQQTRTGLTGPSGGFGQQGGIGGLGGGIGGIGGQYPGSAGYNPTAQAGGLGGNQFGTGGGFGSQQAGRSSFAQRLQNVVNRASSGGGGDIVVLNQVKIIADERTNSLLIFAAKEDIKTIKDIIAKLDVVLPQVLIEAIIMEVSLDDSLKYGISYLQPGHRVGNWQGASAINNGQQFGGITALSSLATNATLAAPSGFSYFGKLGNDFEIAAEAIATDNRINVLSRPHIQTSHAVEANLFVGETRPYITGTYQYYGGGPSSQYSQLQIGITLSVLPLINPDGLVVMDIRQKIQSIGGTVKIDNNELPATIDREANAKVSVRDRETVILGGFISSERSKSASGVPLLKDIPLLGNLFRSTSKSNTRRELMVLIRPTVLPTPEIAANHVREQTAGMPGILAAQKEQNEADRKRLEKLQKETSKELFKREGLSETNKPAALPQ